MAVKHDAFALAANTPLVIATIPAGNPLTSVIVSNTDSASIFLGDSSVVTGNTIDRGIKVATSANQQVWLNAGDVLYAVSLAGTGGAYNVSVLYSNVLP
jgi:putative cofactor-binding repeat protein